MKPAAPAWLERWPIAYVHPDKPWTVTDTRRWAVVIPESGQARQVDPAEDPYLPGMARALEHGRLIGYRYGRRAVVVTPSSYIKVVRPSRVSRLARTMAAVASATAGFSTPTVRSISNDGRVEVSIVDGTSLHNRLRADPTAPLDAVAGLMRAFHQARLPLQFEVRSLDAPERWVRVVSRAEPAFERELATAAASLPLLERRSETIVHGDLHDKNVLLSRHRLGLIDFDALGRGAAEDDVANLGVHIELRAMQAGMEPTLGRRRALGLYRAYAELGALDWERIRIVERHTWFRLACLYRYRRTSRRLCSAMLYRSAGDVPPDSGSVSSHPCDSLNLP